MKHLSAVVFSLVAGSAAQAQLTVTDSLSVGTITQLLEGLNVTITDLEVNCPGSAMGHFSGLSELDIDEGLLLTTGLAASVAGPVDFFGNFAQDTPGDADLDALDFMMWPSYDACILEFDCMPNGDALLFNFSFGSEEYPEFVSSEFNDVFAIWLSGPGFPIPTNVAALPNGTTVMINLVNHLENSEYYHDNETPPGQYTTYDGFTTNLTVFAEVEPDADYHFKIAIADKADNLFDSGVFLEAHSFRSTDLSTRVPSVNSPAFRMLRDGDRLTLLLPDGLPSGARIAVTNATGQCVQRLRASGDRVDLDLGDLQKGIYTVQLLGDASVRPIRFVKD